MEFWASQEDISFPYLFCRLFLPERGKTCTVLKQQVEPAWFTPIWNVCSIWETCELNTVCPFTAHAIHYLKGGRWQSDWLLPYYDYFPKAKIKLLVPERLFSQQVMPIKEVLRSDGNGGCARSATSPLQGWWFLAFVALSFVWPLMSEKVAGISASLIISDMWLALANLLKRMCLLCSRLACTHGRGISAEYFKLGI